VLELEIKRYTFLNGYNSASVEVLDDLKLVQFSKTQSHLKQKISFK